VSDLGRVRSLDRTVFAINRWGDLAPRRYRGQLLAVLPNAERGGYNYVNLHDRGQHMRRVAVLVAAAFIGPRPDGLQVCHEDGINTRDHASNLYYGTPAQNTADKLRHGAVPFGEAHANATLTQEEVEWIRAQPRRGQAAIGARFGVCQQHVSNIQRRNRRAHG
jgi:hypothetical protein